MKRLLLAVMFFALSLPGLASALTYTPTVSDLAGWKSLGGTSESNLLKNEDLRPFGFQGVKLTGDLYASGPGSSLPNQGYEWIGAVFANPVDLSAYDKFALFVSNQNESPWNYSLYLWDWNYSPAVSEPFPLTIPNGSSATLQMDLQEWAAKGVDISHVQSVALFVESDTVPMLIPSGIDRTFETMVAPVPEPGTMMLLGAGLLGLAIYGKRRKNV